MRLHRLEITGFGPFAEPQRIDFDDLTEAGLFLLHGPTGAGKTSVLDAICFALYGRVPGQRGSSGRYRSDHLDPTVRAEVVCEFTVSGRRLEVTRSPEWQRPKKRGAGFTRENARVVVRERAGDEWIGLTHRMDEAGDLIGQLIGLGPEQFTKIVLLPQGEFAAFLRASAEERRPLLQKLFSTDRFAAVENWLGERRREAAGSVTAARAETSRLLARAEEARLATAGLVRRAGRGGISGPGAPSTPQPSGLPDLDQPDPDQLDLDRVEAVADLVRTWADEAHQQMVTGRADVLKAEAEHERARAEHEARAEQARLRQRRRELTAEHDLLLSQAQEQVSRRTRLQAAGHAPLLLPLLAELDAASTEVETAEFRVELAGQGVEKSDAEKLAAFTEPSGLTQFPGLGEISDRSGSTDPDEPPRPAGSAALSEPSGPGKRENLVEFAAFAGPTASAGLAALASLRAELATLTSLLPAELELRRLDRQAQTGQERLEQAEAERGKAETSGAKLNEQAEKLLAARNDSEVLASSADDRRQDRERAKKVAEAVLTAQALNEQQIGLEDELRAATDEHQAAVAAAQELQARRLAGMAAELAAGLIEGDACPVCGGLDHPHPARPGDPSTDSVTEDEQHLAAERESEKAEIRELARQAVEAGRQQLAAVGALTGGADAEAAIATLSAAQSGLEEATRAAAKVQKLTAELAGLATKLESARSRLESATDAASEAREELAALEGHRADLRERVEAARGEDPSVQLRHARVAAAVEALTEHAEAARTLREARARAARAAEAADQAARAAGFPDHQQAAAAALPDRERSELAEAIADHDARLSRVSALLEELAPTPEDIPDTLVETLRTTFESARATHRAAQEHHTLATRAAQALARLATDLQTHAVQTAPLRTSFITLEAVSRCAEGTGGDNQLRMRLSSYVLAARLEQVAQAASVRLAAMSGGRYELVHTDGPARGGARSGLGLAVVDGWTGVQRDPSTLSGGETFCTSLALALGLADVVQAEAGGAIIETLLVDEGFGSLDEDTLDEVMDVLDGLRSGGRAVGLVSHVADLRDRIPAQLEVVKTRTGSRLRSAVPA